MNFVSVVILTGIVSVAFTHAFAQNLTCDTSLWDHVYNPDRLRIVNPCVTVTGMIEDIRPEADGDFHILVRLDVPYAHMINEGNIDHQHGDLVVETICENEVTQPDAIASCSDFSGSIEIPSVGTNVTITGTYVFDSQHYDWAEIHPATSINPVEIPEFPLPVLGLVLSLATSLIIIFRIQSKES